MSIRIQGTTVIDDSRNATNLVSASVSSTATAITAIGDGQVNTYRGVIRIGNTASAQWGGISFPDSVNGSNTASNNYYFIGRGGAISSRMLSFHIPTASDYGSGSQPRFVFASTGADELFTIQSSTGNSYVKGNLSVGTTSPAERIRANGNIRADGQFQSHVTNHGGLTVYNPNGNLGYSIRTVTGGGWAWRFVDSTAISPGTEYFRVDYPSGNAIARGEMQGTLFRDANNTAFFCDPNSTSRLNLLNLSGYGWVVGQTTNGQSFFQWDGATFRNPNQHTPSLLIRADNSTTGINGFRPALALYNNNGANQTTVGLTFVSAEGATGAGNSVNLAGIIAKKESAGNVNGWSPGSLWFFVKDFGTRRDGMFIASSGYVQSDFSFRAPIFFDSNNTAFFCDPNSRSNFSSLNIGGSPSHNSRPLNAADEIRSFGASAGFRMDDRTSTTDQNRSRVIYTSSDILRFWRGGSGDQMVLNSAGQLGLGTTSPATTAHINGTTGDTRIRVSANDGTNFRGYEIRAGTTFKGGIFYRTSEGNVLQIWGTNSSSGYMFINSDNNGGIGTSDINSAYSYARKLVIRQTNDVSTSRGPGIALQAYGTARFAVFSMENNSGKVGELYYDTTAFNWNFRTSGSAIRLSINDAGVVQASGDMRAPIFYDTNNTAFFVDPASTSNINVVNATQYQSRLTSYNNPDLLVTRLNDPNWSYGISSNDSTIYWMQVKFFGVGNDNRGFRVLDANGNVVRWRINGAGNMFATGNITAFSSDSRLKTVKNNIKNAIEKVKKINGVEFEWNEKTREVGFDAVSPGDKDIGVLAQELQSVLPEAVTNAPFDYQDGKSKSGENYLTVDYAKITPLLIEAIKEQQEIIEKMNKRLEYLENLNSDA
jgi:hypothetical protein